MQRILVGVDTAPDAGEVVQAAASLAQRTRARLVLARAVGLVVEVPNEAAMVPPLTLEDTLMREAQDALARLASTLGPGVVESVRVEVGSPWEVLCRLGREVDAAVIVVGGHKHGVLGRMLGTTATHVVNHADRSVLVVRAPALLAQRQVPPPGGPAPAPGRP